MSNRAHPHAQKMVEWANDMLINKDTVWQFKMPNLDGESIGWEDCNGGYAPNWNIEVEYRRKPVITKRYYLASDHFNAFHEVIASHEKAKMVAVFEGGNLVSVSLI